jgi:hypothetical protein
MKPILSIEHAEILLEKYYEGMTSLAEEKQLRDFLQQEDLPERFDTERALFGFFERERSATEKTVVSPLPLDTPLPTLEAGRTNAPPPRSLLRPLLRIAAMLTIAIATGGLLLGRHTQSLHQNVAYINGKRCTDPETVKALALASIHQVNLSSDEIHQTLAEVDDFHLLESQLAPFSPIE